MRAADWVILVLTVLDSLLAQLTKAQAPQQEIDRVMSAITNLRAVQGSQVTWTQLESFRIEMTWVQPEPPAPTS